MHDLTQQKVFFPRQACAELSTEPISVDLLPHQILGRTLVSVISSGSETGGYMNYFGGNTYPCSTGYAAVMEVLSIGEKAEQFSVGDIVFVEAPHQLYQIADAAMAVRVPSGMKPEEAVLARFPAVSMTTMIHTAIRPTEPMLVTGLGIVGLMCSQVMTRCGYAVYAVDPSASRRETGRMCGLQHVFSSLDELNDMKGRFGLAMECSGNDFATLGVLDLLRPGGELSIIGVPWRKTSDASAHDLFRLIFNNYIHMYSGWEWSLPRRSGRFQPNSTMHSFETAMEWIRDGSLRTQGIYRLYRPEQCSQLYETIAQGKLDVTCAMFDWR